MDTENNEEIQEVDEITETTEEVTEEQKELIRTDYKEEVIETESCKIMMGTDGSIHIECSKPTDKIKISKQELDMLQGLSEIVPNKD